MKALYLAHENAKDSEIVELQSGPRAELRKDRAVRLNDKDADPLLLQGIATLEPLGAEVPALKEEVKTDGEKEVKKEEIRRKRGRV